jgi:type I restriction enzyme S subunit
MQEAKIVHKKKVTAPKLRFKEFSDAWNDKKLGDVLEITSASRVHKDEWTENGVPFFRSSDVVAAFKGNENTKAYISFELYTSLANKSGRVKKDDILITGGGSIGIPFLIKNNEPLYFKDADLLWIKNTNEISGYFLYSFFLTQSFKNYINTTSHVGTIAHYTVIQAKNTPFQFPSLPEQQKIAGFLSAVDEKIQLLNRKKQLLEQYKIGVMQQLFSGKLRFKDKNGKDYPNWEEKNLGDICEYKNGGSFENLVCDDGMYNLISLNSIDINGKLKPEHKKVSANDNSLSKGDLVMVLSDVAHGYFLGMTDVIPSDNFVLNQRMGALKPKVNIDRYFLKTIINANQRYFKLMGQGSSQKNLSKDDVLNFTFQQPAIEEQKKLADFLSAIDVKIESLSKQINQTQNFKKGLLQQMFV